MNRTIFITGATSGFGKAIAEKFAAIGDHLIITGRRKDRLEKLSLDLQKDFGIKVYPLNFDVCEKETVFREMQKLPEKWRSIDILINNAGLALGRDYFDEASLDDWDTMLDTNVKGLLYVTKAVIPYLKKGGGGQIINIGSIAGKEVYEKGNAYCASKHAVDAISKSMRIDLLRHAIKVTVIHPGAAETEFSLVRFKGDETLAKSVYTGFQPLIANDIADVVLYCANLPDHVCINELTIMPTAQASSVYFHKV
ncbi:MAG: SDR family NAD(P)-dependent oxidoreductase [Chitinophagaceae bacterium]